MNIPALRSRARVAVAVLSLSVLALSACATTPAPTGSADGEPGAGSASAGSEALTGELTIFAAASLKAGFDALAEDFEQRYPGADVQPISYDGSSTLATQIIEGAPADVFASADEANMQKVVDSGLADAPDLFATNRLTLVVPAGNPAQVTGIGDLADADLTVVQCAAEVPCGAASTRLLDAAGVRASVDSYEQNVTAVLTKVASGEADAGLVYITDAATTDDVETVETAGADTVVNRYPIAVLGDAADPDLAAAFVAFVLSDDGRGVLEELGFGAP